MIAFPKEFNGNAINIMIGNDDGSEEIRGYIVYNDPSVIGISYKINNEEEKEFELGSSSTSHYFTLQDMTNLSLTSFSTLQVVAIINPDGEKTYRRIRVDKLPTSN